MRHRELFRDKEILFHEITSEKTLPILIKNLNCPKCNIRGLSLCVAEIFVVAFSFLFFISYVNKQSQTSQNFSFTRRTTERKFYLTLKLASERGRGEEACQQRERDCDGMNETKAIVIRKINKQFSEQHQHTPSAPILLSHLPRSFSY